MDDNNGSGSHDEYKTFRVPTQPGQPEKTPKSSPRDDLSAAFSEDSEPVSAPSLRQKPSGKHHLTKIRKCAIILASVGVIALIAGVSFLVCRLMSASTADDAAYLVSVSKWQRQDAPEVVWQFSDIGSGTLTTNSSENQYDFAWALQDGQLKIDTDWLYTLNDTFDYSLDQTAETLTLKSGAETITFVPAKTN